MNDGPKNEMIQLRISSSKTIQDLKSKIEKMDQESLAIMHLEFNGKKLLMHKTLLELGIKQKSTFDLVNDSKGMICPKLFLINIQLNTICFSH